MNRPIQERYLIKPATLPRIEELKKFLGAEVFEQILQGIAEIDIPFDETRYCDLMRLFVEEQATAQLLNIPYSDAGEIIGFFCKPFAGKYLKQANFMLSGISSLLEKVDPAIIMTAMESTLSRKKNGITLDQSSSQKEILSPENGSTTAPLHQSSLN